MHREVGTIGTADLDIDGRAETSVPSSTDPTILFATTGVSRVRRSY